MILGSLAPEIRPKLALPSVLVGGLKLEWLIALKNSERNCSFHFSSKKAKFLRAARSTPTVPGPVITARPEVPNRMGFCWTKQEVLKNLSTVCWSLGRFGLQTRSGRNA